MFWVNIRCVLGEYQVCTRLILKAISRKKCCTIVYCSEKQLDLFAWVE